MIQRMFQKIGIVPNIFVFLFVGTSLTGIAQRSSFTKLAALRAVPFVQRPVTANNPDVTMST